MRTTSINLFAIVVSVVSASKSWGGSNLYFLHGLNDSAQNAYLDGLHDAGAKVVRLWVDKVTQGCDKGTPKPNIVPDLEEQIGTYNDAVLDALDLVLMKVQQRQMKAIISPHDANRVNGSNEIDAYGLAYGTSLNFYADPMAASQYDARLTHILNYQGKYSRQVWSQWSSAIMAFDIENEPMGVDISACTGGDIHDWICPRAQNMRKQMRSSSVKVSTGGIGGDVSHNCTFTEKVVQCAAVDMIAIHGYKGTEAEYPNEWSSNTPAWIKAANGKLVYIEEFGTPENSTGPSQLIDFAAQTDDIDQGAIPWVYWQIVPPQECSPIGSDKFGVFQNETAAIKSAMQRAAITDTAQDWSGIVD